MPPEPIVFFIDRSLGSRRIAQRLRLLGASIEVLADHFAEDCPDTEWLAEVGRRGWFVLTTKDKWIRRRRDELAALERSGTGVSILGAGNRTGEQMAELLCGHFDGMVRLARTLARPFIVIVRPCSLLVWRAAARG